MACCGEFNCCRGRCENRTGNIIQPTLPSVVGAPIDWPTLLMQPNLTVNRGRVQFCSGTDMIQFFEKFIFCTGQCRNGTAHIIQPKFGAIFWKVQFPQWSLWKLNCSHQPTQIRWNVRYLHLWVLLFFSKQTLMSSLEQFICCCAGCKRWNANRNLMPQTPPSSRVQKCNSNAEGTINKILLQGIPFPVLQFVTHRQESALFSQHSTKTSRN